MLDEAAAEIGPSCATVTGDIREKEQARAIVKAGARAPRPSRFRAQQRRWPVLRPGGGDHREGLASGPAAERRRDAQYVRGRLRACDAARGRRDDRERHRVPSPWDAGDGPHGRRPRGGRGVHARTGGSGKQTASRLSRSRSGGSPPSRCASTRPSYGRARPPRCRYSGWATCRSTGGSLRCSPRRSDRRSRVPSSRSTARLDNWNGPWPPAGITREGEVPTEERRPSRAGPAPKPTGQEFSARQGGYHLRTPAGEVLWLHRSLPSF